MTNTQPGDESLAADAPSSQPLKSRVIRASTWLLGARIIQQLILLLRPLVLARILAPDDFGVMGIALMTRLLLTQIGISGGLKDALIRRDDLTRQHYATVWTFEVVRLGLIGGALAGFAPVVADFFNTPAATPIIRITGLELALISFTSIGMVLVRKELEFNKEFYYNMLPAVIGTGMTIWLAFELRSVWALALGQLTQSVLMVVMSYVVAPYFVRPTWHISKLKDLAGFAVWSSIGSILAVIVTQMDRLFVGRIMGSTSLGLYVLAGRVANLVSIEMSYAVVRVGFPAFARVQQNPATVSKALSQLLASSILILGPLAIYINVWAPEIIEVLLGDQWLDAESAVRTLAGSAVLFALAQIYSTILRSMGRALISATADALKLVTLLGMGYPLISNLGLPGAGLTVAISSAVALVYLIWRSRDIMPGGTVYIARYLLLAILLSVGLLFSFYIHHVHDFNVVGRFLSGGFAFVAGYVVVSYILHRYFQTGPMYLFLVIRNRRN